MEATGISVSFVFNETNSIEYSINFVWKKRKAAANSTLKFSSQMFMLILLDWVTLNVVLTNYAVNNRNNSRYALRNTPPLRHKLVLYPCKWLEVYT